LQFSLDKRWLAAAGVAAGIGIVGYALFSQKTPEERIRSQLERLSEVIRVGEEQENPVVRGARLNGQFAELFDKDVRAEIPELSNPIAGRKELVQLAARAHFWVRTLDVDFSRLDIEAGEVNARASGPARLSGTRTSGEPETGERQVRFTLTRTDSDWMIDSVKVEPQSHAE
jgi:hypothetical protein